MVLYYDPHCPLLRMGDHFVLNVFTMGRTAVSSKSWELREVFDHGGSVLRCLRCCYRD